MNYQKEYAALVGQVDRAITLLEQCTLEEPLVRKAAALLIAAIQDAEERYIAMAESA